MGKERKNTGEVLPKAMGDEEQEQELAVEECEGRRGVDASTELVLELDVKHGLSPELGSERGSHGFAHGT